MNLEIQNLSIHYTRRKQTFPAVENFSLRIRPGEIVGLVGESACGKSTLALSILDFSSPHSQVTSGQILWDDKNLLSLSPAEMNHIRGRDISFIFQEPYAHMNPVMPVGRQAAEPLLIHEGTSLANALPRVQTLFAELGISDPLSRMSRYPFEMSGGQLQRVLTTTALIAGPRLILADEPTTAIDTSSQRQLLGIFKKLRDENQTRFLIISHDLPMIASIADTLAVMYCGRLVEQGKTGDILSSPLHPYTQGLLETEIIPSRWQALKTIPGEVPNPAQKPSGCAFHPRCPKASEICTKEVPAWREHKTGHFTACFHAT